MRITSDIGISDAANFSRTPFNVSITYLVYRNHHVRHESPLHYSLLSVVGTCQIFVGGFLRILSILSVIEYGETNGALTSMTTKFTVSTWTVFLLVIFTSFILI